MQGVAAAGELKPCTFSRLCAGSAFRHSSRPSCASNASVTIAPSATPVTNTRSPATMGDDTPRGTTACQRTFLSGPNTVGGRAASAAIPA
eukprot:gene47830-64157_t